MSPGPPTPTGWQTSTTLVAGIALGITLLAVGTLLSRADVAVLGVPALLGALWGWHRRPTTPATAAFVDHDDAVVERGALTARLRLEAPGADLAHVRVAGPDAGLAERVVLVDGTRTLECTARSVRTGLRSPFVAEHRAYGTEGAQEQNLLTVSTAARTVLPHADRLHRLPTPRQLRGLTGPHTSRRIGDGSELRDIDAFRPGDRLRRIDWRATARRSPALDTLYVRRTFATAEATVVLVLDSRDDVGPDLTTWGGHGRIHPDDATSLDIARTAAATVAQTVVDAGDRIGYEDLGRVRRPVPPAGGRRQLRRVLHGLALARPYGEPGARHRPPQVPSGAFLYIFSTFLDDEPLRVATLWHENGHQVVAVDTLPDIRPGTAQRNVLLAWQVTRMEREDRIRALATEGIDVVRWVTSPGLPSARSQLELAARRRDRHGSAGVPRR